ncbi:hypothetical protein Mucpa_4271 [Mucilaginibacter paludis DSM 18603]|uniref:Uncharacterized protein n=1 Tax=Mucilaginibacter paludis DSM 18603 TaxID=714943 RepID=H1Y6V4_9SPHI|nr:hypothetical protein Mucpa_4271 [Mucilaginibacter paludis DSM 18603]
MRFGVNQSRLSADTCKSHILLQRYGFYLMDTNLRIGTNFTNESEFSRIVIDTNFTNKGEFSRITKRNLAYGYNDKWKCLG